MPITEAAKLTPYTATFLRQLGRQGKNRRDQNSPRQTNHQEELKRFLKSQAARHEQALLTLQSTHQRRWVLTPFNFIVPEKEHENRSPSRSAEESATLMLDYGDLTRRSIDCNDRRWRHYACPYAGQL